MYNRNFNTDYNELPLSPLSFGEGPGVRSEKYHKLWRSPRVRSKRLIYFVVILFPFALSAQLIERNLTACKWTFKQKQNIKWLKATVPGTVHTDLFCNKLIPDPFYANNEKQLQWIENEDWEYQTTFTISKSEFSQSHIELQFDGLDTYASVYVNDSLILLADNMFRTWNVAIKKYIHQGKNKLHIVFESAVKRGKEEAKKLAYTLPGEEKVFTRKAQYQYGWDWGPRFVTCGIWKDIKLVSWNTAHISTVKYIRKSLTDSLAELEFVCELKSDIDANAYLDLALGNTKDLSGQINSKIKLQKGVHTYSLFYTIKNPQRWWCNGLGFPTLYNFVVSLSFDSKFLDTKSIDIGLRTLELVQEKDTTGTSFYFKLNGVPVFMKGANYIPQDNFLPRIKKEDYHQLVKNAVDANMNMLRVWGGGVYGADDFYAECNQQGILVWQDMMFACAMYPGDERFLKNVAEEIIDQTKRLRNHPCLALWCGNNEIDEGWKNWGWQKQYNYSEKDSTKIENDYLQLFNNLAKDIIAVNDHEHAYWPSSPSIGWGHKESLQQGDSHYWGVWWGNEPFATYNQKVGRFVSEYGFQGMPNKNTLQKIGVIHFDKQKKNMDKTDLVIINAHQKHSSGFETIANYMERDYKLPKNMDSYIYVSQLLQAEGMKTAIEAHRKAKPHCMGTLYWQLNDCWPVTSWSTVDYYNSWKASHYLVKKKYENVLLIVNEAKDQYQIYVVNDGLESMSRTLFLRLIDFNGKLLWSKTKEVTIAPNSSLIYDSVDKNELRNFDPKQTVLSVSLFIPQVAEVANTLFYFVKPKDLQLQHPTIAVSSAFGNFSRGEGGRKRRWGERERKHLQCISLESNVLAKDVCITVAGESVNFSDNFFDLLPGETKTVYLPRNFKVRNLKRKIVVNSLIDSY